MSKYTKQYLLNLDFYNSREDEIRLWKAPLLVPRKVPLGNAVVGDIFHSWVGTIICLS